LKSSINVYLKAHDARTLVKKRMVRLAVEDQGLLDCGWKTVMKNPFTNSSQKWVRYRLATSSLFTNKSKEKVEERLCSFCNDNTETSEHLFYECSAVVPIRKIVEPLLLEEFGIFLKKKDWLLAVHPESKCAFQADAVLTKVIGMIYAARSRNRPIPTHMASIIYREVEALLQ
ncbi:Uncharacterized protein FKW44_021328, partial [Caligus rogercresseyi]